MREIRSYGSEGGGAHTLPTPITHAYVTSERATEGRAQSCSMA
jgi:hypothetical protein